MYICVCVYYRGSVVFVVYDFIGNRESWCVYFVLFDGLKENLVFFRSLYQLYQLYFCINCSEIGWEI